MAVLAVSQSCMGTREELTLPACQQLRSPARLHFVYRWLIPPSLRTPSFPPSFFANVSAHGTLFTSSSSLLQLRQLTSNLCYQKSLRRSFCRSCSLDCKLSSHPSQLAPRNPSATADSSRLLPQQTRRSRSSVSDEHLSAQKSQFTSAATPHPLQSSPSAFQHLQSTWEALFSSGTLLVASRRRSS